MEKTTLPSPQQVDSTAEFRPDPEPISCIDNEVDLDIYVAGVVSLHGCNIWKFTFVAHLWLSYSNLISRSSSHEMQPVTSDNFLKLP